MPDCTHVILVFDDGTSKVYDPAKIDSIFFDDDKARCFAKHCLKNGGGPPDEPGKSERSLDAAIEARDEGNPGKAGEHGGGANPGSPTQEATLTSTAVATEPTTIVAGVSPPCIHMRDCTWDCGTT